ncbi:Na+/H+ antiporter subunit E [Roseomonas hellenica]|uniref:Na+/H+ antiporter subunit E n=1 Tax=Plastoroseomonas hellenica TaxID=2687306 RepID=A0ABS5F0L3_9PROT|nr:Na+/H+ antiporter subunit E [Plastoroseomonas hellenica]MBR0666096.1 Na+/H+ antiporter subunit E [Plastoroseomonas hellenica]
MRRLLPYPFVSAALFLLWLLLNESVAPGTALVGAVLALLGGWSFALLEPGTARVRRLGTALRLLGLVLADVVRSNIDVARIILGPHRVHRSGFIEIPLTLRNPQGLAALACILTATPGSAWVEYDSGEGMLLLHVLDLADEAAWVRTVKDRYEAPLMEIFP